MFRFDELNTFENLEATKSQIRQGIMPADALEESFLDMLIDFYLEGVEEVSRFLGVEITPDPVLMSESIEKTYDGKGFRERLREYGGVDGERTETEIADTFKVLDTDSHRVYQSAINDAAILSGQPLYKTWVTRMDDRVREEHTYLEGITIPVDEEFYTYDGDHALYPGGFETAENNANCRCEISLTKG